MAKFSGSFRSFKEGFQRKLLWEYWLAIKEHAWETLWGAGLVGGFFVFYTLYYAPSARLLGWVIAWAVLVAGYYAWRADHTRLMPRFEVKQFVIQPTETEDPNSMNMFIQIVPECIGDAHVQDCRGRLLRVYKRKTEQEEWQLTQMDAPLFLGWDYYGHGPFALEPGVRQRLNVCWWSDKINSIIPAVEPLPSKFRVVFGSGGMFKFDIRLSAKDCSPVDVSLMVSRDGRQWNDPIVQFMP